MSSDGRTCRRPPAFRRVTVGAAEDGPRTARPSRRSTLQLLDTAMGCHAAASWSSAPTPSRTTRFGQDDTARPWPLTATATGMATSWRRGGSTSTRTETRNQDRDPTHCQRSDRSPDSHRRARPRQQSDALVVVADASAKKRAQPALATESGQPQWQAEGLLLRAWRGRNDLAGQGRTVASRAHHDCPRGLRCGAAYDRLPGHSLAATLRN